VDAALHRNNGHAFTLAEYEIAGMSDRCGSRKMGQFGIGDHSARLKSIGVGTKAGTENQPENWSLGMA